MIGRDSNSGTLVIVRTHGDRPKLRYLWKLGKIGSIVAEEAAYRRLLAGHDPLAAGAVTVPSEDIFEYDGAEGPDADTPFEGWDRLRPYGI
jgi:hypothetical protein